MIRLSEAIARVYCQDEIIESYVHEAFVLLQKSIIRVEHDDVELGEEADDDSNNLNNEAMDVDTGDAVRGIKKIIDHEKYNNMTEIIVTKLRSVQSASDDDDKDAGMTRNNLIDWYLELKEDDLESEEDLEEERLLIGLVLTKMIREGMLMEIRETTYSDDSEVREGSGEEPIIVVDIQCTIGVE
jgi:DNA replication licensing factor MCM6